MADIEKMLTLIAKNAHKIKNNPDARSRIIRAIEAIKPAPTSEQKVMTAETARNLPNELIMKILRHVRYAHQVTDYWAGRKIMIARFCSLPYKAWLPTSHPARCSSARNWDKVMGELKDKQDITSYPLIS